MSTKPALSTPTSTNGGKAPLDTLSKKSASSRSQFVDLAVTMTWQLALVVLLPVIGGALLSKATGSIVWVIVGLVIALLGSVAVLRNIVRAANRFPVPKLTDAEKKAVSKSYEEDDD